MPTHNTPQMPFTPWTDQAPTGSSIFSFRSVTHTDSIVKMAAVEPMTAAAHGCTNAHGAVMATRPASMPLAIMLGSGLPARFITQNMPTVAPNAAAMAVFVATTANRMSATDNVDAALKP